MILFGDQTTVNGYPCDVVISALQKFIRRGKTEEAARAAYELERTSEELREYLWKRLLVISVEDIGLGEPLAPVQIFTLNQTRQLFLNTPGEFGMFFVHAVRYLCHCKKERGSCNLSLLIQARMADGGIPLEFPDYVYDRHTVGQCMAIQTICVFLLFRSLYAAGRQKKRHVRPMSWLCLGHSGWSCSGSV